jgi:hypothetical protein
VLWAGVALYPRSLRSWRAKLATAGWLARRRWGYDVDLAPSPAGLVAGLAVIRCGGRLCPARRGEGGTAPEAASIRYVAELLGADGRSAG